LQNDNAFAPLQSPEESTPAVWEGVSILLRPLQHKQEGVQKALLICLKQTGGMKESTWNEAAKRTMMPPIRRQRLSHWTVIQKWSWYLTIDDLVSTGLSRRH